MAEERPIQEWFPRARVSLQIRFEEFAATPSATPPKTKQMLRKGTSSDKELEYVKDPDATPGTTRYILQPKSSSKIKAASADNLTHSLWGVIPINANLSRNGLDKASTLSLEISYLDAPFDPRCIRSCAVEYYLGTITGDEVSMEQSSDKPTMVPDTYVDPRGNVRSNKRMSGWVDTWEVGFEEGHPVVKLECRDNRSVLIDQQAPPQLHLDPKLPLDKAIADYLSNFPQFAGIGVMWRGDTTQSGTDEAPKLNSIVVQKGQTKGTQTGKDKCTVMDYLTDMVGAAGCILMMEDTTIVVTKPRTVLNRKTSRSSDQHKDAGRTINGMALPNRTFIYGHNVKSMRFGRKFNAAAPTNIEVRAYLGSSKKTIIARFPDITTSAAPGEGADKKWLVWRVQGVSSKETLKIIAQSVYEQSARKELSVDLDTTDLASFGGGNDDPDLLDMLPGDSFDAYLMREQEEATTIGGMEDKALIGSKLIELLTQMGHDQKLAQAYSQSYVAGGFQCVFRTRAVKIDWSIETGVKIGVSGSNYVEVRLDKDIT